jgi:alpha-L-fucosidase
MVTLGSWLAAPGIWLIAWLAASAPAVHAQAPYIPPSDPLVQQKLEQWQDLKFGLLMHWGPYSQWGVVESWSICPEDEPWCRRDSVARRDLQRVRAQLRGAADHLQPT